MRIGENLCRCWRIGCDPDFFFGVADSPAARCSILCRRGKLNLWGMYQSKQGSPPNKIITKSTYKKTNILCAFRLPQLLLYSAQASG